MSRHFRQPRALDIRPDPSGQPAWLRWRGRRERVRVCNAWRIERAWWQGESAGRAYYTLLTTTRAALVVYRDEATGGWFLERVVD